MVTREIIHIISRNSNWKAEEIKQTLQSEVYTGKSDWIKFLNILLLGLGVAFCISGIIFFFAFNWDEMPEAVKIGLVEVLIVASVSIALFSRFTPVIKSIIMTGAALLVGALFGVFGQIYQTGANAYDFFLAWTVFIALWAFAVNFPPLWLVFMTLVNITVWMYYDQVADWEKLTRNNILFLINSGFLVVYETLYRKKIIKNRPVWLNYIVTLATVTLISSGVIFVIFENEFTVASGWCLFLCLAGFSGAVIYGLRYKNVFYIATIPAAAVAIISFLIGKWMDDAISMFFLIGIFIVASITLIIKLIITLNTNWNGNK